MSYKLLIVESPAKAKTIGRYLGKDYKLMASVGHIRDLPTSTLGVNVNANYKPRYVNMPGKGTVIREMKQLAESAEDILIATDPDREGEAIAWHIAKILNIDTNLKSRVKFNEITEKAIKEAVNESQKINMNLVNAQQARRILDRLVGYELSPLLWEKVKSGTSAGRVQSVATKLIVDREREISNFEPQEYWNISADLKTKKNEIIHVNYFGEVDGKKVKSKELKSEKDVNELLDKIKDQSFSVYSVKKGTRQRKPYAPFTTSTLQQEASKRLGFSAKRTMALAQQLYEGVEIRSVGQTSLITYIRTDSVRISDEALKESRDYILSTYGKDYLPSKPRYYSNKKQSQDAHEAIRPSHFDLKPEAVASSLNSDQLKLYNLIWNRFIASQMNNAICDTLTIDVAVNKQIFRATGQNIKFQGFLLAYSDIKRKVEEIEADGDEEEKKSLSENNINLLPLVEEKETLDLEKIDKKQKFTNPPPRYSEASLIKEMESLGIGRPSTYSPTISTIVDRAKYAKKEQKVLSPTELGEVVTNILSENFPQIVDSSFTADMENWLDEIEDGEKDWTEVLDNFYPDFHKKIILAKDMIEKVKSNDIPIGENCPECGAELIKKEGRYGEFIACSNFPSCKYRRSIVDRVAAHCPLCGSGLLRLKSRRSAIFYVCDKEKDKDCQFISWDLPIDGEKCEHCGSYMVWHRFRNRQYKKCSNADCESNKKTTIDNKKIKSQSKKKKSKENTDKNS